MKPAGWALDSDLSSRTVHTSAAWRPVAPSPMVTAGQRAPVASAREAQAA